MDKVITVFANVMGVAPETVTSDSSPDTVESWDSLKHVNLILALEQEFGVKFTDDHIMEMLNVSTIIQTIDQLKG